MKKTTKTILSLLATVLCLGALGVTGYYIYELRNNPTEPVVKEKYKVEINYYKDDAFDSEVSQNFEVEEGYLLDLTKYKIDIEGYKFVSKDITQWALLVENDVEVNFYYFLDESSGEEDGNIDIQTKIYISDEGIDGNYTLDDIVNINDIPPASVSITYLYNNISANYPSYYLNYSASQIISNSATLYLYKNVGEVEPPVEPDTFDISVNLYYSDNGVDGEYIGGNSYGISGCTIETTINDLLNSIYLQDNNFTRDYTINFELSSLVGNKCELYIYKDHVHTLTTTYSLVCSGCHKDLNISESSIGDGVTIALNVTCSDINCGGTGSYQVLERKECSNCLEVVSYEYVHTGNIEEEKDNVLLEWYEKTK